MNIRPAHQRDGRWRIHATKTVFNSSAKSLENIFVFLLPLIATNILQNLSGTINTIFVGQMMGVDAIAAVSVFPHFVLLLAFIIGISTGTTVLVGQAWGAQNIEKVQSVVGSTLFMTIIGGIITAIIGVFLPMIF